jgi:hypothetical protein
MACCRCECSEDDAVPAAAPRVLDSRPSNLPSLSVTPLPPTPLPPLARSTDAFCLWSAVTEVRLRKVRLRRCFSVREFAAAAAAAAAAAPPLPSRLVLTGLGMRGPEMGDAISGGVLLLAAAETHDLSSLLLLCSGHASDASSGAKVSSKPVV